MAPSTRRECEQELLDAYYEQLIEGGVDSNSYSRQLCLEDYV